MPASEIENDKPDINIESLRKRYRIERDRRAASDASERQYLDIEQGFSDLLSDPYGTAPARAPFHDTVDVLVVGGGFGGLLTAARLREANVKKIRIVEVGSEFGGTWYWNRYPGAACDIESYIYFPLLEETGYMPVERYSKAAEIREHCIRIAKHYNLYDDSCFSTQVTSLDWDAKSAHWDVKTNRGDHMKARFVVLSTGPLNRPKLPDIAGIENFKGHSFHTSRWDYAYTGGSATTPLDRLKDKRVGIIGTGATAVQCIPPLAASSKELLVFQRTPSSVDARANSPTDAEWVKSLTPGWQQRRMENFTAQFTQELPAGDEVSDGWTVLARAVRRKFVEANGSANPGALLEEADFEKMVEIRDRISKVVADPTTAEALKPWFSLYCKRPCFHDDYLKTFNRPNVSLVDTAGRGVERITQTDLVVEGREYPVDCLIFATGFEVSTGYAKRSGMQIKGVCGLSINEKWADGMSTLHGFLTRGFPNCFFISQAQSGMSPNFPHMLSEQTQHIAHIIQHCQTNNVETIEPHADAETEWVQTIVKMGKSRQAFIEACTPSYYNNEGRVSAVTAKNSAFGAGPIAFVKLLKDWRDEGSLPGFDVDGAHARTRNKEQT